MCVDWKNAIRKKREAKDEYFRSDPHSPILPEDRDSFDGLSYYPVDASYRFELLLHECADKGTTTVGTSTGSEQVYVQWGEFRFELAGERVRIQAYKREPDDNRLWVPLRDATSGEETYGAGRYLDLERETHQVDEDKWILDFNEAYNPTYAYADHYECPLPPTENWLRVPIEAGEKAYK